MNSHDFKIVSLPGVAVDSSNQFCVGVDGNERVVICEPVRLVMTREEAINLAAWLCVLADPKGTKVREMMDLITDA